MKVKPFSGFTLSTTSHQSQVLAVQQEVKQEPGGNQEPRSITEAFLRMLPRDSRSTFRWIIAGACLYEFFHSGNAVMLLTAYSIAEGSVLQKLPDSSGAP